MGVCAIHVEMYVVIPGPVGVCGNTLWGDA